MRADRPYPQCPPAPRPVATNGPPTHHPGKSVKRAYQFRTPVDHPPPAERRQRQRAEDRREPTPQAQRHSVQPTTTAADRQPPAAVTPASRPRPHRYAVTTVSRHVACPSGPAVDELLRHDLGRAGPSPLLPTHPRLRPRLRRRRSLRRPPTRRHLPRPVDPRSRPDPQRNLATSPRSPRTPTPATSVAKAPD